MKENFIKITTFFLLTILLSGYMVNLHVLLHEHDHHCTAQHDHDNQETDNTPCDLCLIVLKFNSLDYYDNVEPNIVNEDIHMVYHDKAYSFYQSENYNSHFIHLNKNKAPPHIS